MTSVEEQLEDARKNLLDMSLRNKLLNFKQYKRSTAEVVDEVPAEIYQQLVLDETAMSFVPNEQDDTPTNYDAVSEDNVVTIADDGSHRCLRCEDSNATFSSADGFLDHLQSEHAATIPDWDASEDGPDRIEDLWALPELSQGGDDRHTDTFLQTPHTEADLQKRLYHISNRADALIQDAGYNALHLAVGFLHWTEAEAHEDPNRAPLILIPVTLDRDGAHSAFTVAWNQEEVAGNLSLDLKLSEQGFELPEFVQPDDKDGIRAYLEAVNEQIADLDQWDVIPEVHLGFFDFTKFIMYQDLDPEQWSAGKSPADHHLIRALLSPDETTTEPEPFEPDEIDDSLSPLDVHHVKDADPSQIAASEDVKRGRNLVIEGPPGTGKSQTIVNIVAELMASGKSILFVSEKLAALEVVKDRLDSVGIGDFALELHSDKASKSDFLEELERISRLDSYNPDVPDETIETLEQRIRELNAYADALGEPIGELEVTPYALYGWREEARANFESADGDFPRIKIDAPAAVTPSQRQAAKSELEAYGNRLTGVEPVRANTWYGCEPGQVLSDDRRVIETRLTGALESLTELSNAKSELETDCAVYGTASGAELEVALEAAIHLRESEPVDAELLQNSAWNHVPTDATELIKLVTRARELRDDAGFRMDPTAVHRSVPELLAEYRDLSDRVSRFVRLRWYTVRRDLSKLYVDDVPNTSEKIIGDLEALIELSEKQTEIKEAQTRGRELFGSLWDGIESTPSSLRGFAEWMVEFRANLLDDIYGDDTLELVTRGTSRDDLGETIEETRSCFEAWITQRDAVFTAIGLDTSVVFDDDLERTPFEDIESYLEMLCADIDRLERWSRYDQSRRDVRDTAAAPLIELAEAGTLGTTDLIPCFEGNLADALLSVAFRNRDPLARFDGDVHESRIDSFKQLDRESLQIHQRRVLASLVERSPRLMQGASKSSPAGILLHEFGKERRHMPIRKLLHEAGDLVQKMKPCFMMSPLSVAKYLEPDGPTFDVVIFDEASQVKPEDALGTIARGSQVVLLGDSKQLPPTSFFDHVVDQREPEDQWEFNIQDVESILDLSRSSFPAKRLKWHYRSRHESLIAVSNQEFYDNELLIYPSPVQDESELGLRLNHLPDTIYDRGGSSVNREEAKAVATAAVEHYRDYPSKSLGVGTFSQSQQQAVQEEIERLRKETPEVDEYFGRGREEPFFVKNLERIQGDERDVIFISVGYGYDATGSFSHNFGPLNTAGGWRRLNVLITRARERCVVFSNFTADDLDASKLNSRGVRALKVFLEYAETRNLKSLTEVGVDPDSPFERAAIRFLETEGFQVHPQVGCAGFRIDIGIPDPNSPGRYVLGIECDGAAYHSSPVARARDRQRQDILEDRGWRIHRIWSTDWYREQERTKERLLNAVEQAVDNGTLTISGTQTPKPRGDGGSTNVNVNDNPSIEELQSDRADLTLADLGEPYVRASSVPYCLLGDYDVRTTTNAVIHVVTKEGPIHRDLLASRLIERSDVSREGKKVAQTIDRSINVAAENGRLEKRGGFLYPPEYKGAVVRRREGEEADIEWIPEEEIRLAIARILESQYETPMSDLVTQVAKLLGFARTGKRISNRIESAIGAMGRTNQLGRRNGRVTLQDE